MALWNRYPWTNFNELNLDWIMRIIKEIKTEDIPDLDKKIDNVYNFISENLPEIVASLTSVIIDVTLYGAVGDGVTDNTQAIKDSLNAGDILYFPPGQYCFKEVEVFKQVILLGTGEDSVLVPIRKHANTNQFFTMFKFNDSAIIRNLKLWADNSVVTQTGDPMYNDAAFIFEGVKFVYFDGVIFDHIFETYRKSVSDLNFPYRQGMAVYTYNCEHVIFDKCEIRDFGGEELIQICRDRPDFGGGFVSITNCYFHDRHSRDTGSAINTFGGIVIFANNVISNFDNLYSDGVSGGSLVNLTGAYSIVANNYFHNCVCGNYFDISEGYFTKAEYALIIGNIMDGNAKHPIRIMARKVWIEDNYIAANQCIRTFIATDSPASTLPYGGTWSADASTTFSFDQITIRNNEFYSIPVPYGSDETGSYETILGLGQHPADQTPRMPYIIVEGNNFRRHPDSAIKGTLYFASKVGRAYVQNNIFENTGISYPTIIGDNSAKAFISAFDAVSYLNIIDNVFDASLDAVNNYFIFSGLDAARTDSYYMIANNTVILSHATSTPSTVYNYYNHGSLPDPAHVTENNNVNTISHNT